jgi:transcriptional regulator with XRE-family HTH domain
LSSIIFGKPSLFYMSRGERLRIWRKSKGLTLTQLGDIINTKANSLSEIETGTTKDPSAETLAALDRLTDINLSWLLNGGERPMVKETILCREGVDRLVAEGAAAHVVVKTYPPDLQPFIETLVEIMQSGDEEIKVATGQNLKTFREVVRRRPTLGPSPKKAGGRGGKV